jgi:hypothetical protein
VSNLARVNEQLCPTTHYTAHTTTSVIDAINCAATPVSVMANTDRRSLPEHTESHINRDALDDARQAGWINQRRTVHSFPLLTPDDMKKSSAQLAAEIAAARLQAAEHEIMRQTNLGAIVSREIDEDYNRAAASRPTDASAYSLKPPPRARMCAVFDPNTIQRIAQDRREIAALAARRRQLELDAEIAHLEQQR